MSESYVTAGGLLRCNYGDRESALQVPVDHKSFINNKPEGNITDFKTAVNIQPFGMCGTRNNPEVDRATSRNKDRLKPMPCMPVTESPWQNGKTDLLIAGQPALLTSSCLRCKWGGVIRIVDCGQ
jgi:hypothetical protein